MGINLEYYMSVLKEQEFFHNLIHDFFFIISSTVELLCVELIDLYTVTSADTLLWTTYSRWEIQRIVRFFQYRQSYF